MRVLQSGYECVLLIICGDYFTEDVWIMKEKSYLYTVKGAFGGSRKRLMNTGDAIHRKKRNDSYEQEELFEEGLWMSAGCCDGDSHRLGGNRLFVETKVARRVRKSILGCFLRKSSSQHL